ncbi:MAG TPA: secretin N-terminal domain-containing protein [Pirellulaceae bacterium]|nr:secretin N-terminal domain-containing protein [Pirellulaceae bacterium]HMP69406.1 secretin N-terminal domain-containing protein [Pirellulaceae bacterium]
MPLTRNFPQTSEYREVAARGRELWPFCRVARFFSACLIAIVLVNVGHSGLHAKFVFVGSWQDETPQEDRVTEYLERSKAIDETDRRIRFAFSNQPWRDVIEWFAEQGGFTLQFLDQPPNEVFSYRDSVSYSIGEAIDFLNQQLRIKGYTLIRTKNMLSFVDSSKGVPLDLIELVTVDELESRGRYEVLRCVFNLQGVDFQQFVAEVRELISESHVRYMAAIPSSNQLRVQETGQVLRTIQANLESAKKSRGMENFNMEVIRLEHFNVSDAMNIARDILGIAPNATKTPDGDLNFSIDIVGNRVYVSGEPIRVNQIKRVLETIDVKTSDVDELNLEVPYVKPHAVRGDIRKVFQVMQTMLLGRPDVRLDFDETNGTLIAQGRTPDHEKIQEIIEAIQTQSDGFDVFIPVHLSPTELASQLTEFFKKPGVEASAQTGPTFQVDRNRGRILAKGTPQEISLIKKLVAELDTPTGAFESARGSRVIPMDELEIGVGIDALMDLWSTLGIDNPIDIMPTSDRVLRFNRERGLFVEHGLDKSSRNAPAQEGNRRSTEPNPDDGETIEPESQPSSQPSRERRFQGNSDRSQGNFQLPRQHSAQAATELVSHSTRKPVVAQAAYRTLREQDQDDDSEKEKSDNGHGRPSTDMQKSDEQDDQGGVSDDSQPGVADRSDSANDDRTSRQSVPGAPIRVRVTQFGIVIESDDFEAVSMTEKLILDALDMTSDLFARPAKHYLKHRDVLEAETLLREILGLPERGGGGGGLGGLVPNLFGGGGSNTGDIVQGLLGGGASSSGTSSGIIPLDGEVNLVADPRFQVLYVRASVRDQEIIKGIIEDLDRPDAPHDPNMLGETHIIYVEYRSPTEVADIIRETHKEILRDKGGSGADPAQAAQAAQAQQMQQFMQALTGRGGRGGGGGGNDKDASRSKVSLTVDESRSALVVTGPEYLCLQIRAAAKLLDQPGADAFHVSEWVPLDVNSEAIISGLRSTFGSNKIVVTTGDAPANTTTQSREATQNQAGQQGQQVNRGAQQQQRPNMMQMPQGLDMGQIFRQLQGGGAGQRGQGGGQQRGQGAQGGRGGGGGNFRGFGGGGGGGR